MRRARQPFSTDFNFPPRSERAKNIYSAIMQTVAVRSATALNHPPLPLWSSAGHSATHGRGTARRNPATSRHAAYPVRATGLSNNNTSGFNIKARARPARLIQLRLTPSATHRPAAIIPSVPAAAAPRGPPRHPSNRGDIAAATPTFLRA